MAKLNGVEEWKKIRTLKQAADVLEKSPDGMLLVVKSILTKPLYSRAAVLELLELDDAEFAQTSLSRNTQTSMALRVI